MNKRSFAAAIALTALTSALVGCGSNDYTIEFSEAGSTGGNDATATLPGVDGSASSGDGSDAATSADGSASDDGSVAMTGADGGQDSGSMGPDASGTMNPVDAGSDAGGVMTVDAGQACVQVSDCPASTNGCIDVTCTAGHCGQSPKAASAMSSTQTSGDCHDAVCDGAGGVTSSIDNTDVPVDGNPCTQDICTAGVPSNPPAGAGGTCGTTGANTCDGAGNCTGCAMASECPGTDTECQTRTCTAAVCGFSYTASGTATKAQTPGDCQQNQCNGAGAIVSAALNTDVPVDGNDCTQDVCTAGVPSNPDSTAGTACGTTGTMACDGAGSCTGCVTAATCPGTDTECQTRTCTAAKCGVSNTSSTHVLTTQTPGDCKTVTCDGNGGTESVASSMDLPVDGNACTDDICTGTTPSNPDSALGTACGVGGMVCDGNGSCSGCTTGADCPGTDTTCQTRTCNASVCGVSDAAAGTACTENKGTVCDAAGACQVAFGVAETTPTDGASAIATHPGTLVLTFTRPVKASTLLPTATPADFACTGPIQLSIDNFSSCAYALGAPTLSVNNTVATFSGLEFFQGSTYQVRVTTDVTDATGVALSGTYTSAGFTTGNDGMTGVSVNETGFSNEIDYCNVQFPTPSFNVTTGTSTGTIYGRVYEQGTTGNGNPENLFAQVGYGPVNANPEYDVSWSWTNAVRNPTFNDNSNDEYMGSFTAPAPGDYRYAYRFSLDGNSWTVCDIDGAGSNFGLAMDYGTEAVMTVTK